MPNESHICRICRRVLFLKKSRRVLLTNLPRSSMVQERIDGLKNVNREDYRVARGTGTPKDRDEVKRREVLSLELCFKVGQEMLS
jgi:hypothetical protein